MAKLPAVEVSCSYTVVETTPLSPFVWALLRALQVFPSGARPGFEELAIKLNIGELSFVEQAWAECLDQDLVSTTIQDFQSAELNSNGHTAIARGYVVVGAPRRREGETLYFRLRDGDVIKWQAHFTVTEHKSLVKPKWGDGLTEQHLAQAVNAQSGNESRHITAQQRIEFLTIDWAESRQVIISTDRQA